MDTYLYMYVMRNDELIALFRQNYVQYFIKKGSLLKKQGQKYYLNLEKKRLCYIRAFISFIILMEYYEYVVMRC